MKHWLAALIAVAAFGAGCDRGNEPAEDRRVPETTTGEVQNQNTDISGAVSPGVAPGNVTPQQGAPRESGGGLDVESADDSQHLQQEKTQKSLERAAGEEGVTGPVDTTQSQSQTQAIENQTSETQTSDVQTSDVQTSQNQSQNDQGTLSPSDRKEREGEIVAAPTTTPEQTPSESGGQEELEQSQETQQEQGGLQASSGAVDQCPDDKYSKPKFLRADIAYSVTGQDCHGDLPSSYSINQGLPQDAQSRAPASEKQSTCANHESWSHPLFLRQDIAYGVTGEDCYGDEPYSRD